MEVATHRINELELSEREREQIKNVLEAVDVEESTAPPTFLMSRDLIQQSKDIYSSFMEGLGGDTKVISSLGNVIGNHNIYDFYGLQIALAQALYNQNVYRAYITGEKANRREDLAGVIDVIRGDNSLGFAVIKISLNDLTRNAYGTTGTPNDKQKKTIQSLIDGLNDTPLEVFTADGDVHKRYLIRKFDEERKKGRGGRIKTFYTLVLHEVFANGVMRNFGAFPQDFTQKLTEVAGKGKTDLHLGIAMLLAIQDKRKPCTFIVKNLIERIGYEEQYKKERGRVETKLLKVLDDLKRLGMIKNHRETYTSGRKKVMERIIINLNEEYGKILPK